MMLLFFFSLLSKKRQINNNDNDDYKASSQDRNVFVLEWLIVCHCLVVVELKFALFPSCVSHQDSLYDYMKQRDENESSSSNNNKQI